MRTGAARNLKGLRPEAREIALEAARRSGQSLGDWLNDVILEQRADAGLPAHDDIGDIFDDDLRSVHARLDDLTRRIDRSMRSGSGLGPDAYAPKSYETKRAAMQQGEPTREEADKLAQLISRLDKRLEQFANPSRPVAPGMPVAPAWPPQPPVAPNAPQGIDRAVAEIAARQRALDGKPPLPAAIAPAPAVHAPAPMQAPVPTQDLSGLEQQLRTITTQIETLRRPGVEEAINALRDELADIARAVTEAVPRKKIDSIEKEIHGLSRRVAEGKQAGIAEGALSGIEHGLAEVRDALRSLTPAENLIGFNEAVHGLAEKIDLIVAQKDPATLQQLETAVNTLRGISSTVASDEAVGRLANEVHALAAKVDEIAAGGPGAAALANLEERIAALSEGLAARSQSGAAIPPQLEALVSSLSEKIEQVQLTRGDTLAAGHLEDRIVKLVEKLDASDSRLGNLEVIERGLADLLLHMGDANKNAIRDGASVPVDSLKRDIEAVHGTLGQVVERLATIEQNIVSARVATPTLQQPVEQAVAHMMSPPLAPQAPVEAPMPAQPRMPAAPPVQFSAPVPTPMQAQPAAAPPKASPPKAAPLKAALPQRKTQPIDPNLPPDHPIEPGTASPAARIAASEAALGNIKPPVISDSGKSDFIAAARRAAKAATAAEPLSAPQPPLRAEPTQAVPEKAASLREKLSKRVKAVFVSASMIAIVIGSVQIVTDMLGSGDELMKTAATKAPGTTPGKDLAQFNPLASSPTPTQPKLAAEVVAKSQISKSEEAAPAAAAPSEHSEVTGSIDRPQPAFPPIIPRAAEAAADKLPAAIGSQLLRDAAAKGDVGAAYEVAVRYSDGTGVARSFEDAARWFDRAAGAGLAMAQFRLGSLYEKGQGVRKDLKEARRLYLLAAETGNAKAMHNLAVLYAEGIDGKPDYKTAVQWFRKAAERGVADSQYNLGILHARGMGTDKNMSESYKWFALSAAQGDKEAAKKRDEVMSRLDGASQVAAQTLVKLWSAQPQPDLAVSVPVPAGGWDTAPARTDIPLAPRKGASAGASARLAR